MSDTPALPPIPQRTTPGFSFSVVERSLRECIADRRFGKAETELVALRFDNSCTYCGAETIQRWDHVFPVSRGGDTVLGNIVPACAKCDDSKRDLRFDEWATGDAPNSPRSRGVPDVERRLDRIREYVEAYSYAPREPGARLTPDELQEYELIRSELKSMRVHVDQLVSSYRARTGGR